MSLTNYFYHGTTRRYIALFGSVFNKISITRQDEDDGDFQMLVVPIEYGPYQKWLLKTTQDRDLNFKPAMTLPRMAFEIDAITPDLERKRGSMKKLRFDNRHAYEPAPYNIDFTLSIMTKFAGDGLQIVEQILPFFKPERTMTVQIIDGAPPFDIPLELTGIAYEDIYESDFDSRRSIMWTLNFTMRCWYFGPVRDAAVIKFIDVRMKTSQTPGAPVDARIVVQPGLTANGEPTTSLADTVPYDKIDYEDDWGVITVLSENLSEDSLEEGEP